MQIQRICRAQRDQLFLGRRLANGTQQTDSLRQGKLFTAYSPYKITTANLAARFPSAINSPQLIPRSRETLAFEQTAKHDAITMQQHSRNLFDGFIVRGTCRSISRWLRGNVRPQQRPTSGKFDAGEVWFAPPFPDVPTKRGTFI